MCKIASGQKEKEKGGKEEKERKLNEKEPIAMRFVNVHRINIRSTRSLVRWRVSALFHKFDLILFYFTILLPLPSAVSTRNETERKRNNRMRLTPSAQKFALV